MKVLLLAAILGVVLLGIFLFFIFISKQKNAVALPYRLKYRLFSKSEFEFIKILNQKIDNARYTIFPKVRLADFIEVDVRGKEFQTWFNKIKSKHVDFLVWDLVQNKIAVAIELDGNSHDSEKMRERDIFVDEVYKTIGLTLKRVRVGSDFQIEATNIARDLRGGDQHESQ